MGKCEIYECQSKRARFNLINDKLGEGVVTGRQWKSTAARETAVWKTFVIDCSSTT